MAKAEAGVAISSLCQSEEGNDRLIKVRELDEVRTMNMNCELCGFVLCIMNYEFRRM
jgi:hypothetical protein